MEQVPFVLSGGGARGVAHIGVIAACAEAGVVPSAISATSAGALVGAFIAAGWTPKRLSELVHEEWGLHLTRWRVLRGERLTQRVLGELLEAHLGVRRFEELSIPFHVTATDFITGAQRIFSSGPLVPALLAASAVPMVFPAVVIDGVPYVDGGLSNNLPIEPFADRRAETVAVYVNPLPPWTGRRRLAATIDRVFHLSFRPMVARSAQGCRLYIEPPELARFGMFDLRHLAEIERVGYAYAREVMGGASR
ncbi:MAG: patatin-like phospholipase family protein [Flavobacteriales bacterium]|nr:patatin-like phospholipase family protein [Flavobacteriales bacterium]